jgi:hypothetical protein
MRHTFAVDVFACPSCGGRMRVVATIEDAVVIRKILTHLGLRLTCPRLVHRRPTCSTGADLVRAVCRAPSPKVRPPAASGALLTPSGPLQRGAEPSGGADISLKATRASADGTQARAGLSRSRRP